MEINQENRNYEFPVVLVENVHEKKKKTLNALCVMHVLATNMY